jgi:predicted nucleic acid-binding protein
VARATQATELAAVKSQLLDTGPLVAYLDARDPSHDEAVACIDSFSGQFHTTAAVITEAMHFVSAAADGAALLAEFVGASRTRVHDFAQPPDLRAAAALMAKYSDTPMDFADATLVLLAERIDVVDVLTLDRRGFSAYRTPSGRALQIFARP